MSKIDKLFHRVRDERYRPSFAEFQKLIQAAGFVLRGRRGSHRSYRNPAVPRILTIQPNGNMAEDYQVREFLAMVAAHGLWTGDR